MEMKDGEIFQAAPIGKGKGGERCENSEYESPTSVYNGSLFGLFMIFRRFNNISVIKRLESRRY